MSKKSKKKKVQREANTTLARRFSVNVLRHRHKAGLSQSEVARKLSVTPAAISKMESSDKAQRRNPSLDVVEKLARIFKVDPAALFAEPPKGKVKVARKAVTKHRRTSRKVHRDVAKSKAVKAKAKAPKRTPHAPAAPVEATNGTTPVTQTPDAITA